LGNGVLRRQRSTGRPVDLAGRVLRVVRSYDPGSQRFVAPKSKNGTREVGIPRLLIPHLAALDRTKGLVFGPTGSVPFNPAKLHERANGAWRAANERAAESAADELRDVRPDELLDRITLPECRHTYASHMIAAGVNIKRISEYLGHASITITLDRYGHLLPGDRETVMDQLDAYHAGCRPAGYHWGTRDDDNP
jgi:integrase